MAAEFNRDKGLGMGHPRAFLFASILLFAGCAPSVRFGSGGPGPAPDKGGDHRFVVANPDRLLSEALKYKGVPYKWGGEDMRGIDCSGLVKRVFWECERVKLPHKASAQAEYGIKVSPSALQCGDLLFFRMDAFSVDHVGIYLEGGRFVHASPSLGVTESRLDEKAFSKGFAFARRLFYE